MSSDAKHKTVNAWINKQIKENGWQIVVAWDQAIMVLCGIRDSRLHDNSFELVIELDLMCNNFTDIQHDFAKGSKLEVPQHSRSRKNESKD